MKLSLVFGCILLAGQCAWSGTITHQSGISQIEISGVLQVESTDAKDDGLVSVYALWGTQDTPEARTAARSGAQEMAVNARIDDKFRYSATDFSNVLSQASYIINVEPESLFVRNSGLSFVLPASYLEVTSTAEIPYITLETVLIADLRLCLAIACSSSDAIFHMQANLDASHRNFNWSVSVDGDPTLDLTSLRNPTVTDMGVGTFTRTVNVVFPTFEGHVDGRIVPVGSPVTVEYIMQVRARGFGATNIGIAAINDPFLLSTDPVHLAHSVTLTLTQAEANVPEPRSFLLCLVPLGLLLWRRLEAARVCDPKESSPRGSGKTHD